VSRRTVRWAGLVVAGASMVGLAVSSIALGQKLSDRNVRTVRFMGQVQAEAFEFAGAEGRVTTLDQGDTAWGTLRLDWRGQTRDFPIWMEPGVEGEGLSRHEAWFGIVMLEDGAESEEALRAKWTGDGDAPPTIEPRLVAAARYPAEGWDPASWGLVRRSEWVYELVELDPHGPAETSMTVHRKSYKELDELLAPGKRTKPEDRPTDQERASDLWMQAAMQHVTPPAQYKGRSKAIDEVVASMGWPWKTAVVSVMGLVLGIGLAASTVVGRDAIDEI